jgi:triosephosphate isomerase
MRPLVAGNWKMNGLLQQARALCGQILEGSADLECDLLICPPFTAISAAASILQGSDIGLGAQDCSIAGGGAHTGDIAAAMLAELGCQSVILGHSERRAAHHETDDTVRAKVAAALHAGLRPIVCVGETDDERDAGDELAIVGGQVAASLPDGFSGDIAYEPIWAIGTGKVPTIADIAAMHAFIRAELVRSQPAGAAVRILYGGSVKPGNAAEILAVPEVGGALVGGASLVAEDFLAIIAAAQHNL